ncbi:MAG: hypothetical protein KJO06_03145 [Gemmatimonadetes bacterium]|nr:hypothetical protein [Gemmatimonadota bacterium]
MTRISRIPMALALFGLAFLAGCDGVPTEPVDNGAMTEPASLGSNFAAADGARCATIDFEGFDHGASIDGAVLSVFSTTLTVSSERWTADTGGSLVSHPAKAFDTDSTVPTEDKDLQVTGLCSACAPLDNIIIIEDPLGFATDGDSRFGGEITITGFGPLAGLTLESVTFVDTDDDETPAYVQVDGGTVATASLTGDGTVEVKSGLAASLTNTIKLVLPQGTSGGFDNLEVCQAGGGEGCTPGYWKQPHHFDSWPSAYNTGDTFGSVFAACGGGDSLQRPESGSICNKTLLQALKLRGGGLNALGRHAVAALLSSSTVSYDLTPGQVIDAVNGALTSNSYSSTKNMLADFNEQNCPLN